MTADRGVWLSDVFGVPAAGPEEQLAHVRRHEVGPDELALQFDLRHPVAAKVSSGELDRSAVETLRPVDARLHRMSAAGRGTSRTSVPLTTPSSNP